MSLTVFYIGIFIHLVTDADGQVCANFEDEKWTISKTRSVCYFFSENSAKANYDESKTACQGRGAVLGSIKSQEERMYLGNRTEDVDEFWVGLTKPTNSFGDPKDNWAWTDGTPYLPSETRWYNGEVLESGATGTPEPNSIDVCAYLADWKYLYGTTEQICNSSPKRYICTKDPLPGIVGPTPDPNVSPPSTKPPPEKGSSTTTIAIVVAVVAVVAIAVTVIVVVVILRKKKSDEQHRDDIRRSHANGPLEIETTFAQERKTWHENGRTVEPLDIDTDA